MATQYTEDQGNGRVGELLHRITDDVKTIAHDEIELVKEELAHTAKAAAVDAAVILLAGSWRSSGLECCAFARSWRSRPSSTRWRCGCC